MVQTKKSKDLDLKEIVLSDDSNIILPEVSYPSNYNPQGEIKYGAKSTEQKLASEHELLEYQKRISKTDSILTPQQIRDLVSETAQRRKALEQSILEQKDQYMQRHNLEIHERRTKQREEERARRIANENDTQRQIREAVEQEIKTNRTKEIQALVNKCRKEKEEIETFFLQSSNRFNEKYGNATKKVAGDTGIGRIISSRPFSTNHYAHRCCLCGYHNPESLAISKIYQHLYEDKDKHSQFTIDEIDRYYNNLISNTKRRHIAEDNPDENQKRISKEIEQLRKLKGAKYL